MSDVMALLKDRLAKAEAKLTRAIKALESAKKELADLQAAERVMAEITGESAEDKGVPTSISDRDKDMAKLLETGSDAAISPIDLYPRYLEATGDTINLDAFRTALWRLQKKVIQGEERTWIVRSDNGKYWREPASPADDFDELLG
ncbi:hypothetical protein GGR88_002592 [Sphingomonas jejuensis]|uniref:Uncharacterized protein n=1 Tax=Sphingomonas jejuensis TaxID=904715 RepID=A0ABX0XPD9_9SPHN|nr:hypothetical protein [Sphingomonas jejuensis]NJC35078.1 hypothetical protein [Sphingomonas jejuensis]